MIRSLNPAPVLLSLLVFSGCSSEKSSGSPANPVPGGNGTAASLDAGSGGEGGSGLAGTAGTSTGTSGKGGSGNGGSGSGASGAGASGSGSGASRAGASGSGSGTSGAGASGSDAGASSAGSSGNGDGGGSSSGAGGMTGGTGGTPPMSGACVGDWMAGAYPADFITGGGNSSLPAIGGRNYAVQVPTGYDCHVPTPLLYCLHGLGQNGYMFCVGGSSTPTRTGGLAAKADEAGFIIVMPSGLTPQDSDVQVIRDIFKELDTHLNIDHKRAYATGHSFGGSLSFMLACNAADLFTAVAPNAWTMAPSPCTPAQPIAVLASHGDADSIAPPGDLGATMSTFASADGCSAMETPATVPASGGDTTCVTHAGCTGSVEVTYCVVKGGGHVWFGDPSCGTGASGGCGIVGANSNYYVNTDFAWDFLKRFSR